VFYSVDLFDLTSFCLFLDVMTSANAHVFQSAMKQF